jgi:hypothetical protein
MWNPFHSILHIDDISKQERLAQPKTSKLLFKVQRQEINLLFCVDADLAKRILSPNSTLAH